MLKDPGVHPSGDLIHDQCFGPMLGSNSDDFLPAVSYNHGAKDPTRLRNFEAHIPNEKLLPERNVSNYETSSSYFTVPTIDSKADYNARANDQDTKTELWAWSIIDLDSRHRVFVRIGETIQCTTQH